MNALKISLSLFLILFALSACAPIEPRQGMTIDQVTKMANGGLTMVANKGGLQLYQTNGDISRKNYLSSTGGKFDPASDLYYAFRNGVYVKTLSGADLNAMNEGFDSLADKNIAKTLNVNASQYRSLVTLGINSPQALKAMQDEQSTHKGLYGNSTDISAVIQYASDKKDAAKRGISVDKLVETRNESKRKTDIAVKQAIKKNEEGFKKKWDQLSKSGSSFVALQENAMRMMDANKDWQNAAEAAVNMNRYPLCTTLVVTMTAGELTGAHYPQDQKTNMAILGAALAHYRQYQLKHGISDQQLDSAMEPYISIFKKSGQNAVNQYLPDCTNTYNYFAAIAG